MVRQRLRGPIALCLGAVVILCPGPRVSAQEPPSGPDLSGRVVDASNGEPVRGAILRMIGGQVLAISNRSGQFRVLAMPEGTHEIEIGTSGYTSLRATVSAPSRGPRLFELQPAPIDLGEITVSVTARLEERRRRAPSRVEAFDRAVLESAIAPDVGAFVESQGIANFVPCGDEFVPSDMPNCYWHRNGRRKFDVYIDDLQEIDGAGTSMLWAFDPRDLWTVEFLHDCGELRIYTMAYRERLAAGTATLRPALCEPRTR